jgi:hypothetical protein
MGNYDSVQATCRLTNRFILYLIFSIIILLAPPLAAQQTKRVIALPDQTKASTRLEQQELVPGVDPALLIGKTDQKINFDPIYLKKNSSVIALPAQTNQTWKKSSSTDSLILLKGVDPAIIRVKSYRNTVGNPNSFRSDGSKLAAPMQIEQPKGLLPVSGSEIFLPGVDPALKRALPSPKINPVPNTIRTDAGVQALPATGDSGKKDSLIYLKPIDPDLRQDGPSSKITTMAVNRAPVAVPDVYTIQQGEPLIVSAPGHLANDTDPEGDPISWVSFSIPSNGTVTGATTEGAFTYTPDTGFAGVDQFAITVSDGQGNFTDGLVIILVENNFGPQAVPDLYTTLQGEPLIVPAPGHLANDIDPEGDPLTWISFVNPENGTVSDASTDGTFTYTPDPGFSGIETFTITIGDGQGNFSSGLVVILVEPNFAPTAVPDVYTTTPGEPLVIAAPGHLINDIDPEGDPLTWVSFGVPENGTVSGATTDGAFTYTPDPGFNGTDSFVITITDGNGNFSNGLVNVFVEKNYGPTAVPDVYNTLQDEPLIVSAPGHLVNDTDPEDDPLTWISFGTPENGTVSGATTDGAFTYTPDPGFKGTDSFVITISDGMGNLSSGIVTIAVQSADMDELFANPDAYSTPANQPLIVTAPGHLANDFDPEGDPISWISYGTPANGTVSGATSDGAFTYTPELGFSGIDSFVITISDGQGNFSSSIIMILVEENFAPEAIPDIYTTPYGEPLIISAPGHLTNDFDPEGDPLSWVSFGVPANGTVSGATTDGGFTYTPDSGFTGIDEFPITISDGKGNFANGLVMVLVEPNFAPTAVPDLYTTSQGESLTVLAPGHLANDTDPEGDPLTWISFGIPENGTVSGASTDGTFTYTPDPDFSGIDSFVITISDGNGNFSNGLINIFVEKNLAPTAVPDVYITPFGEPLIISSPGHLANDTDPEGDPLTWISFGVPENGTVSSANTEGAFTYTPDQGFSGIEQFPITISDGKGNFSNGVIAILVEPNTPPISDAGEDLTVVVGLSVTLDGSGSFDPDGDIISYSWAFASEDASDPIPLGSSATLSGATTANPSFTTDLPGVYSVQLIVNDGNEDSAPDYVIVTAITVEEALEQLRDSVTILANDEILNKGQYQALIVKIDKALRQFNRNKISETLDILADLRQQILDLWLIDGVFSEEQATTLLDQIDAIVAAITAEQELSTFKTSGRKASDEALTLNIQESSSNQEQLLTDGLIISTIYPNPFSSTARVVFHLSEATIVRLAVYDATGREVTILSNGYHEAGRHEAQLDAADLAEGTYIVQLATGNGKTIFKRVMLVR